MRTPIKNRSKYPEVFKTAALEELKTSSKTMATIARERNFNQNTLRTWAIDAGIHTSTPRKKTKASTRTATAVKEEVPIVQDENTIYYKGKLFTSRR